jgi:Tol biopolymer transport system component
MRINYFKGLLSALLLSITFHMTYAQAAQDSFGKNRIQYKSFDWQYLSSNNFDIYYYQEGAPIAVNAAHYAETEFNRISELFGFAPYTKVKLFIYNSKADLQQSNVGLVVDNSQIGGGQTNLMKSIIEIPFTGNQVDFKEEIRFGIARTLINDMMYGGSFKDMVQSAYLLSLPEWFINGAALYAAEGWSVEMDNHMRDLMLNNKIKKPTRLMGQEAAIAGQSLWNFIAEKYGRANISNILNLTRIIRNEESSIASTLGIQYDRIIRDWRNYYLSMAEMTDENYRMPDKDKRVKKNNRKGYVYNQVRMSPDGKHIAYSENQRGRYRIVVRNIESGKAKVIKHGGALVINQRVDASLPMVAWQSNNILGYIDIRNGQLEYTAVNISGRGKKTVKKLYTFNQVSSFDISDDGRMLVLSADKNGQNDLYLYNISLRTAKQITHDLYDDLNPRFIPGSKAVVFSSNRLSDTLSKEKVSHSKIYNNSNIFVYEPGNDKVLQRITNSVNNEIRPVAYGNDVYYLSDEKGIYNLYRYNRTTRKRNTITDYRQNINAYDLMPDQNKLAFLMLDHGKEHVYVDKAFNPNENVNLLKTKRQDILDERIFQNNFPTVAQTPAEPIEVELEINLADTIAPQKQSIVFSNEIDINNYIFESEKASSPATPKPAEDKPKQKATARQARPMQEVVLRGPFPYRNRLSTDNVVSTMVLDPLPANGLGIRMEVGMTDLFENHKINAGLIAYTNLRSSRFFGEYQYLKHRFDYRVRFEKQSIFLNTEGSLIHRYGISRFDGSMSYPLSVASRVTLGAFYARTKFTDLNTNPAGFGIDDIFQGYVGPSLEYVYDNTIAHGLNMLEGTRMKVRLEHFNAVRNSTKSFGNISVDIRNYQKIHREIVFATRAAFGSFFGRDKKSYLLGGMDNWIFNQTNVTANSEDPLYLSTGSFANEPIDKTDWLFMKYVTNLRGFKYNAVYGNSFLLFNAELRFPIVRYFYRGPITSNFLRNLQLVGFADIGSAWSGRNPFTQDNSYNTQVTRSGNFEITVVNYRNPFLTGYGAGLRTVLLGYYVKFDVARGVQDYNQLPAKFYLTFGHDF